MAAVVLVLVLVASLDIYRMTTNVERVDLELPGAGGGSTNYLLVGVDSREFVRTKADLESFGDAVIVPGTRADLILVLHIPPEGSPTLLALPRDLLVSVPGKGDRRLALTYEDSPQGLVDAVCTSLGLGIDHVASVGFDGFSRIVEAVGGVDVDIDAPLRDPRSGLDIATEGENHLGGTEALALLRSRSAEELVDGEWRLTSGGAEARQEYGGQVLKALGHEIGSTRSPLALRSVASAVSSSITLDSTFGLGEVRELRDQLSKLGVDDSVVERLPSTTIDGPTPIATLDPDATAMLVRLGAGSSPSCRDVPRTQPEMS